MKRKRLSWLVILIGLIAIAAIPALWQMPLAIMPFLMGGSGGPLGEKTAEQVRKEYPRDFYLQLLLAEGAFRRAGDNNDDITKAISRFAPVIKLDPQSPAPHLRLGLWLLQNSGGLNRIEELRGDIPKDYEPEERSPVEQLCLNQAIEQFRQAAALDPKNAAPDYFLAYCYFANKQDALADAALRSALARPEWTIYSREIRQAGLRFYQAKGYAPLVAVNYAHYAEPSTFLHSEPRLRAFARLLTGLGKENLQKGSAAKAAFYLESGAHLGGVYLQHADSLIDGLVAVAILHITSGPFADEKAKQQIEALTTLTKQQKLERLSALRAGNFETFLTTNDRPAAAARCKSELSLGQHFRAQVREKLDRETNLAEKAITSHWLAQAVLWWQQSFFSLLILLAIVFLSLVSLAWREKFPPPAWRWWEGAIIFLLALAPAHIYALFLGPHNPKEFELFGVFNPALLTIRITLPLLVLLPLIGALLKRRRQPAEARLGKIRAVLTSWRILLPPMVALLLLLSVIFTIPAQLVLGKWIKTEREIIRQGEVKYWQIGRPRG
jgi:hypothetical protein